jgi:hypothetical protein
MTAAEFRAKLAAIEIDPVTGSRNMAAVEQLMAEATEDPPVKRNTRRQRVRSQRAKILRRSIRVHVPDPRFAIAVDQLAKAKITADDIFDHLQRVGIENPETGEIRDSLIRYVSVLHTQFKMLGAMALLPATAPPALALPPPRSEEDRRRQAIADYELVRQALTILEELGQPLAVSLAGSDIETTATTVAEYMPALPAGLETIDVTPAEAAPESKEPEQPDPPKTGPIESF